MRIRFFFLLISACLGFSTAAQAAFSVFPEIQRLDTEDLVFMQLEEAIELYYACEGSGETIPELSIYIHTLKYDTDIFSLAAKFNLPYESLATLNRISTAGTVKSGTGILLPSVPGIYLPQVPKSDLECLMASWRSEFEGPRYQIKVQGKGGKTD
jgi:hypothetical protein